MSTRHNNHSRMMGVTHLFAMLVCLLWFGVLAGWADTHYVSLNGTNDVGHSYSNDWSGAATQIQWAVDASTAGDTVLVSNGTYNLTNQINILANITVRSLNGTNVTIVNGNYPAYTNRCVYMSNGVLGGFTISNGFASGISGGGVYVSGGGFVSNCFVYRNYCSNDNALSGGGGIFVSGAGAIVSNCSVVGNIVYGGTAQNYYANSGGGIYLYNGGLAVANYLSGNTAYRKGGGGMAYAGNPGGVFSNCQVIGNQINFSTSGEAGGLYIHSGCAARNCVISNNISIGAHGGVCVVAGKILDSIIVNNIGVVYGGGVSSQYGGLISNCLVKANISSNSVGGIYLDGLYGNGVVANCVIVDNVSMTAGPAGLYVYGIPASGYAQLVKNCLIYGNTNLSGDKGGVYLEGTSNYPYGMINCTIAGNQSATKGGGIYAKGANNYIENCIIYSNVTTNDAYDEIYNDTAANTNNYWHTCASTNLAPSQGNITNNPLFADQVNRNYRLSQNSPCVNAGTNQTWMTNSYDLDGLTRIRYGAVDMGAYEVIYEGTVYRFGF